MRPELELQRSHRSVQRSLKDHGPDSLVVCRHPVIYELKYGQIVRIHLRTDEVEIRFFKIGALDRDFRCHRITEETEPGHFKIKRNEVMRRFIMTNGMINRFCVLNTVRV